MSGNFIDMTGWIMSEHGVPDSRWKVIARTEDYIDSNGNHKPQWFCECDCENHTRKNVLASNLRRGLSLSCGCLSSRTTIGSRVKKYNRFSEKMTDDYGEYYIIYSNPDEKFMGMIDARRIDDIKDYSWSVAKRGYFQANINGKIIKMHQLLFGEWYDHHDDNRLNNREYNMRQCTIQQNQMNRRRWRIGESGYRGVIKDKRRNKYVARLYKTFYNEDGTKTAKVFYGKERDSAEDAYLDYLKLAFEHQGEWSSVEEDYIKYGIASNREESKNI